MFLKKLLQMFADVRTGFVLILTLAIESGIGAWIQVQSGSAVADRIIFHNWFCWPLVLSLFVLYLLVLAIVGGSWCKQDLGRKILLLGCAILLAGVGTSGLFTQTAFLNLGIDEVKIRAEAPNEWELAYRIDDDEGTLTETKDFVDLRVGEDADMGDDTPTITILQKMSFGAAGPGGKLVAIPSLGPGEPLMPALRFSLNDEKDEHTISTQQPNFAIDAHSSLLLRHKGLNLPCALRLKRIEQNNDRATGMPSHVTSIVSFEEATGARESAISENQPLRLDDLTLIQASISADQSDSTRSILLVTRNPFQIIPYIGFGLMLLGFLWQISMRIRKQNHIVLVLLALGFAAFSPSAYAAVPTSFCKLPLLAEGRIKTLDTYAHQLLEEASSKYDVSQMSACEWMFHLAMDSSTDSLPIFGMRNQQALTALGLPAHSHASWNQMLPLTERLDSLAHQVESNPAWSLSRKDQELLRFYRVWMQVYFVHHAFDFLRADTAITHLPQAAQSLVPKPWPQSFLDFSLRSKTIKATVDSLLQKPVGELDAAGQAYLSWVNTSLASADPWADLEFNILPKQTAQGIEWSSPAAEVLRTNLENAEVQNQIMAWKQLYEANQQGNLTELAQASNALQVLNIQTVEQHGVSAHKLWIENIYNRIHLEFWAAFLFCFTLPVALFGLWKQRSNIISGTAIVALLGVAGLAVDLAMRMVIAHRFPIANLYESLLATAAISSGLVLVHGHFRKVAIAPVVASALGLGLLALARVYTDSGADMPALLTVLNSPLWLSSHVLCMTLGLAGLLASGAMAHGVLLLHKLMSNSPMQKQLRKASLDFLWIAMIALLLGSMLGSLWAERVWGHFWNFDAKQNALLITLLSTGLFLLVESRFSARNFAVAILAIVQLATFSSLGIDLLGLGLHNFGFADGTLWGLASFAFAELAFVLWILSGNRKGQRIKTVELAP